MAEKKEDKYQYTDSAVEKLRKKTGLSQSEFAALSCIKLTSYKSMVKRQDEDGSGLSGEKAFRIAAVTGASPGQLMRNQVRYAGENRAYTARDYEQYEKAFTFANNEWKREVIRAIQTRFEDAVDLLDDREGLGFLSSLFFLAVELDKLIASMGLRKDDEGKPLRPTINELVSIVAEQVPDNTDQPVDAVWRKWQVEDFSKMIKDAEKAAREFRKKPPEDRKLKPTRKSKSAQK